MLAIFLKVCYTSLVSVRRSQIFIDNMCAAKNAREIGRFLLWEVRRQVGLRAQRGGGVINRQSVFLVFSRCDRLYNCLVRHYPLIINL